MEPESCPCPATARKAKTQHPQRLRIIRLYLPKTLVSFVLEPSNSKGKPADEVNFQQSLSFDLPHPSILGFVLADSIRLYFFSPPE
jgi:hypothetical protein